MRIAARRARLRKERAIMKIRTLRRCSGLSRSILWVMVIFLGILFGRDIGELVVERELVLGEEKVV